MKMVKPEYAQNYCDVCKIFRVFEFNESDDYVCPVCKNIQTLDIQEPFECDVTCLQCRNETPFNEAKIYWDSMNGNSFICPTCLKKEMSFHTRNKEASQDD